MNGVTCFVSVIKLLCHIGLFHLFVTKCINMGSNNYPFFLFKLKKKEYQKFPKLCLVRMYACIARRVQKSLGRWSVCFLATCAGWGGATGRGHCETMLDSSVALVKCALISNGRLLLHKTHTTHPVVKPWKRFSIPAFLFCFCFCTKAQKCIT